MSSRTRAQLLLPGPLGLVEYDVLEETVFLGPASRGGLTADASPFPRATALLTQTARGWVVRPLPGEAPPQVNGRPAGEQALADGARITLGDEVVALRIRGGPPPAPRPPANASRPRRAPLRPLANPWVTALGLLGAIALLVAAYRALVLFGNVRDAESVRMRVPEPPTPLAAEAGGRPAGLYDEIAAWERDHPEALGEAVDRYRRFLHRYPASERAEQARARIRELTQLAGDQAFADLRAAVEDLLRQKRYATALGGIREFERRHGALAYQEEIARMRERLRGEAQVALEAFLAEVGALVTTDPRAAHRRLIAPGVEFPPDLAAELAALLERARHLMRSQGRPDPPPLPPRPPTGPGPSPPPPEPAPDTPPRPPPPEDAVPGDLVLAQWRQAHADLVAGRHAEALDGYALLIQRFRDSDVYRENAAAIRAGHRAARAGALGPAGLLSVDVETRRGRLEVEYTFDDARVLLDDFSVEQPFPSDRPTRADPGGGQVRLGEVTGLFHVLVWADDVQVEVDAVAEVAHDFGILAVEESETFRAVMLNVANTRFRLKKGDAARVQPGHLLWFMGEGAWSDADPDAIGYVKIAERSTSKIQNGDRITLELIRRGERCEGGFQGRTDGVALEGVVRGDDGRSMGSARIGVFTNTGILVVRRLKIRGTVDMGWFRETLEQLTSLVPPPPVN